MSKSPVLPLRSPPRQLCLLRLSAIGDVTHVLPVVRTIQQYWPDTKITWIIGRLEHQLVADIENIEFIVFDKAQGWRAYWQLRKSLRQRSFDAFLHMQVSLRANLVSLFVRSPVKLGFDKKRAKDFQWLFSNCQIKAQQQQHVLEGFFEFLHALGLNEQTLRWNIPVPQTDHQWASSVIDSQATLIINPSSSQRANNWRNWHEENYAKLIEYAIENFDLNVILTGGPAENEKQLAEAVLSQAIFKDKPKLLNRVSNLVGKTSLKQLAALMQLAKVVVAPDTGPAHIANAIGTPVIGLYVTSNPHRTGPYSFQKFTVNRYPQALKKYEDLNESGAPWGKRVRDPEALNLITIEQVKEKLNAVMARALKTH
jgi:heptosyltransferase I